LRPGKQAKPELQRAGPETCAPADDIRIYFLSKRRGRGRLAAREILKFVHDNRASNRFRDAAVLMRSLDNYYKPLERAFRSLRNSILSRPREFVAHHPLAELTRSALRTVAFDWPHDDWFAALKAGFRPWTRPKLTGLKMRRSPAAGTAQNGANPFKSRIIRNSKKFLERLREKILPPFEHLPRNSRASKKRPNGAQLATSCAGFGQR